jgi:nitrate reductase delta subunit
MGALARLLQRRDRPATGDRPVDTGRGRRGPKDLLHASGMDTDQLRSCWIAASWLLSYPDRDTLDRLPQVRTLVEGMGTTPGGRVGRNQEPARRAVEGLRRTLDAMGDIDRLGVAERYVDTFDTHRKGSLYLTYFSEGDTRRRGMALVRIKQDFRAAGVELVADELPDHLPLVLEFAAGHDPERGAKILRANRPGLELLRLHLEEIDSPWHGAVDAVCATLPSLDADDKDAVLRLAAEGPADEQVGLDGYGADGGMPGMDGSAFTGGCGQEQDALDLAARTREADRERRRTEHAATPGPVPIELTRGPVR